MRALHKKHSKYPAGNIKGNRLIVLEQLHNDIHNIFWRQLKESVEFGEYWDIVGDPNFTINYPTAASREFLVRRFHSMVNDMMIKRIFPELDRILNQLHIKQLYNISDDELAEYVSQVLDELRVSQYRKLIDDEEFDWVIRETRPSTQNELDAGFGQMQDDL